VARMKRLLPPADNRSRVGADHLAVIRSTAERRIERLVLKVMPTFDAS